METRAALPKAQGSRKRQMQGGGWKKRQKTQKAKPVQEGSHEEVLLADVRALFAAQKLLNSTQSNVVDPTPQQQPIEHLEGSLEGPEAATSNNNGDGEDLPTPFSEIEVKVLELSSTGDGLAVRPSSSHIYVVPFTAPGDTVKVKVIRHYKHEHYSVVDFLSVIDRSPLRDDARINCKYFNTCSGCQFQMLEYQEQLRHKKTIVEKAYKNFSQLAPELVPKVQDTMGSPLQYGYRTKLTPHFDGPPGYRSKTLRKMNNGAKVGFQEVPNIGFMQKGTRKTIDIEDCPIGTDTVRMGMARERLRVAEEISKYQKGATILLRESTRRVGNDDEESSKDFPDTIKVVQPQHTDFKSCITDNNGESTEYIDEFIFTSIAGSFFQNNNSILPSFTQYIRDNIMPRDGTSGSLPKIKYLIDAYSGSGLFTITLSSLFESSSGIDISGASIASARKNAELNKLPPSQCTFVAADAPELFKSVDYPSDETVVVIDPPRKGCDESFLNQLLKFGPRRVIYVSCNVHTQARDVGVLVQGVSGVDTRYEVESLRGFDFFPQTSHVEGVAVLNRVLNEDNDS